MNNIMGNIIDGKLIERGFPSISHLPGSKMINDEDKLLGEQETRWLTMRRRVITDKVIITEKVDGMNASVIRIDDKLYPIVRKGYDVRTNERKWIAEFAYFVEDNADRFYQLLNNGERLCGEWMIKTHSIKYDLKHEPYIVFDIIKGKTRVTYDEFTNRVGKEKFIKAGLLHIGEAMKPEIAMEILQNGYHGAIPSPEGVVYKYESCDKYLCSGKFVANPLVGDPLNFKADLPIFNIVKRKYSKYINDIRW